MIKNIDYKRINIILSKLLEDYSGLAYERIVNGTSITGADLTELISPTEEYSICASDSFLLFELLENQDESYITKSNEDNKMITIQSYDFHIRIYGNQSSNDAQKISSIFKQEDIALYLRNNGIYVKGVLPINPINEFINDTLILRRDLTIKIQCKNEFKNIGMTTDYFDQSQNINLIVKKI